MNRNSLAYSTTLGLILLFAPSLVRGEVTLPSLFCDHMVLQRDATIAVWGWADAGETVEGSIAERRFSVKADAEGKWSARLDPLSVGGPFALTVRGIENAVTIDDVYVGEVWLCSGQSNMAMNVSRVTNAEAETAAADFPKLRVFTVSSQHATTPQDECAGQWDVCSPESAGRFSATAYFFGRHLHRELGVPVGLINSSVGGTSIESWTSLEAQSGVAAIQPRLDAWNNEDAAYDGERAQEAHRSALDRWERRRDEAKKAGKTAPRKPRAAVQPRESRNYPGNLFNGKIKPLIPYTIRGAVWYQGENSTGRGFAHLYQPQLTTLIEDWRRRWGQGDFPFIWVQLPNYRQPQQKPVEDSGWCLVQEGMLKTLAEPNTGMAITIDIGEAGDIHPKNKQDVGKRLAVWALGTTYGRDIVYSGPIFDSCERKGDKIVVRFRHTGRGMHASDAGALQGFAVADEDRKFVSASATIEGDTVIVSSPDVRNPVAVRYAWAANPNCNLVNSAGLPASPFRTDNWPVDESGSR
jgi:sialate O-acetylesterase